MVASEGEAEKKETCLCLVQSGVGIRFNFLHVDFTVEYLTRFVDLGGQIREIGGQRRQTPVSRVVYCSYMGVNSNIVLRVA